MNDSVFDVYNDWSEHFRVASHYEIMEDYPSLTDWSQFRGAYTQYVNSFGGNNSNLLNRDINCITLFFPPMKYETSEDYTKRMASASPWNVYKTAIQSVIGLMSRKDANIANMDTAETEYLDNIDGKGSGLQSFIKRKVYPAIMGGHGGILVDYAGDRVVWDCYDARQVSKKHTVIDYCEGMQYLKRVVLVTCEKRETEKEYDYKNVKKSLVLKLVDKSELKNLPLLESIPYTKSKDPKNFVAIYEVVEQVDGEKIKIVRNGYFKSKSGKTFDTIPFFPFSADNGNGNGEPPFFSAAKKDFKQGDIESLFEIALQVSNYPMIVHKKEMESLPTEDGENDGNKVATLEISANTVFEIDQDDDLYFLEWNGKTFELTMKWLYDLAYQITAMIINKLSDQSTAKTKAQYEGEQMTNTATIVSMVDSAEKAIRAANVASAFYLDMGKEKIADIYLNRDFIREVADPNFTNSILSIWESKLISGMTAIKTLQKKEIIDENTNFKVEQETIEQEDVYAGTDLAETE